MRWLPLLVLLGCDGGADPKDTTPDDTSDTDVELDCEPDSVECDGDSLVTCDEDGAIADSEDCDFGCLSGVCNACEPDTIACQGSALITCDDEGSVVSSQTCPDGCDAGACLQVCTDNAQCADTNPCTVDLCDEDPITGARFCSNDADDSIVPDDGIPCTVDTCTAGVEGHTDDHALCEDGPTCTVNTCDPTNPGADSDGCVTSPDDTVCADTFACTLDEACAPSDPNTDPVTGCVRTDSDALCDDGHPCTEAEVCDPDDSGADADGCVAGTPNDALCADSSDCTVDSCTSGGCSNLPDHPFCDDGYACTGTEICGTSGCESGTPAPQLCDDSIPCTVDQCIGDGGDALGCESVPDSSSCGGDTCIAGKGCTPDPTITMLYPENGLSGVDVDDVEVHGTDFTVNATVEIGGVAATDCDYAGVPSLIVCDVPGGSAGQVDVVVTTEDGLSTTASNAWIWTEVVDEADFCNVQFPKGHTGAVGVPQTYFSQLFEDALTNTNSSVAPGVNVDFGISEPNANGTERDPTQSTSWRWSMAVPNSGWDFGQNNDEYEYTFTPVQAASYRYAFRVSFDGGLSWTYCDQNDANGGFDAADVSVLDVPP